MSSSMTLVVLGLLGLSMSTPVKESYDPQDFYQPSLSRIVGGTEAPEGYAPHMVAMVFGDMVKSFSCGGALVSRNHMMTAAHCIDPMVSWIDGQLLDSLRGQIGSNSLSSGYTQIRFSGYENHPEWDRWLIKNDIGLLRLTEPLPKNCHATPIALNVNWVDGGERVHVTGWGLLSAWGVLPDRLQLLRVDTLSPQNCEELVRKANEELGSSPPVCRKVEVCTMHKRGAGQGLCNGDSGSALVDELGRAVALVSWGWPCARGHPDVHARISGFVDWLRAALARTGDVIQV